MKSQQSPAFWIDDSDGTLYITAFYFSVTTVLTVGYGDISAYNNWERGLCIILMLVGCVAFSFATGAISSILESYDAKNAALAEKITTLNELRHEYQIDQEFYNKLASCIRYNHKKRAKDFQEFIEELPDNCRIQLNEIIHKKLYSHVIYLKGKEHSFLSWMTAVMRNCNSSVGDFVYKEKDTCTDSKPLIAYDPIVYFITRGMLGYVLPRFA